MAAYFSLFLVVVTLGSGVIWMLDALIWAPKRKQKLAIAQAADTNISEGGRKGEGGKQIKRERESRKARYG